MRLLIRIVAVVAVLLVLGVVGLSLMLPRLVQSEEVRGRIVEAAREATGREFAYGDLDVGIVPPRLVVTDARLAGSTPKAEPMIEGADVQLRLALMPLLARAVVVDSLVLEGATLRLVRTKDGIELPQSEEAAEKTPAAEDEAEAMALAVRRITLRDLHLVVEDRAVAPPVTWDLSEVEADVRGRSLDAPLDVDLSAKLGSGGSVSVKGTVSQSGPIDLEIGLADVNLAPAASYVGQGGKIAGRVSGSVHAKGDTLENPGVVLDVRLADADIAVDEVSLRGGARIAVDLGQIAAPSGSFELDATDAVLRYGDSFEKPAGTTATLQGRLVPGENGALVVEDTKLRIRNLDGRLSVQTGKRTRVRLDAAPFELEGWEALLPALAEAKPRGRIAFEGLDAVPEPLAVRGRIVLDDLRVAQSGGQDLTLRGVIVGEGAKIASENLVAVVAGQEASLDLSVDNLARTPRVSLRTKLDQADSNALLTAFAGKPNLLSGPLGASFDLTFPLDGSASIVDSLRGDVRFSIEPGRLQGVSLLRRALAPLGTVGDAALLYGRIEGGKDLQRFYEDDFRALGGSLRLRDGVAHADQLRIVYRNYAVDLSGPIRLSDLSLDLRGELAMDKEIEATLRGTTSQPPPASGAPDAATARTPSLVLPIARVTGTVDDPKVRVTREAIVALSTRTGPVGKYREKAVEEVDKYLPGAGKTLLDGLEGILGGRGKR